MLDNLCSNYMVERVWFNIPFAIEIKLSRLHTKLLRKRECPCVNIKASNT